MRNIRTDLAIEANDFHYSGEPSEDVTKTCEKLLGYEVTTLTIGENASRELGKPVGTYISAEFGRLWHSDRASVERAAEMICTLIKRIAPKEAGCILAVGLGNDRVTPDSVGPKAVKKLIVTRHVKEMNPNLYASMGFGECAAVITGVLGETGVESADIIKGVVNQIHPCLILVIDALSARSMERMATTVQVTASGIAPGSGVNNRRAEISEKTMGCPVISLGFPTVVDAGTLTLDMLEDSGASEDMLSAAEEKISGTGRPALFVSPKECDIITDCLGELAAMAVNLFIHGTARLE